MIWDSSPWKAELARMGLNLRRRRGQKRWRESSLALVEREVMVGFYMIRKLMEAKKLSDQFTARPVSLQLHRRTGRVPDLLNWHHLDRFFDFDKSEQVQRTLKFLCDQVVHSFVFMVATADSGGLNGFFVASDRARSGGLFFLSAEEAEAAFVGAANDQVRNARWVRGAEGAMTVTLDGTPPPEVVQFLKGQE